MPAEGKLVESESKDVYLRFPTDPKDDEKDSEKGSASTPSPKKEKTKRLINLLKIQKKVRMVKIIQMNLTLHLMKTLNILPIIQAMSNQKVILAKIRK
ncbi:hypothetical protein ANHYDRO_00856 [Anaerococcus hydrogenalis DSM 7454]|uniref:Uncharacterized protein n=2 Tax=Anaerococcus hydrogenalis TaxID=33029 RepID=B6W8M8_9FIRM|nr:hypothetical protein ANHYDRO_00856 [Anaerococcus hydrogenalis DSM 7454]